MSKRTRRVSSENASQSYTMEEVVMAAQAAVREALRHHKLLGYAIATLRNGKVVSIPPDQIKI